MIVGQYRASLPTLVDGKTADVSLDINGRLQVASTPIGSGATAQQVQGTTADGGTIVGNPFVSALSDGANAIRYLLNAQALGDGTSGTRMSGTGVWRWNGASFDKERANMEITALASASRTSTLNSADLVCYNGRGLTVVVDVTVVGTGSITVTVQGKDPLSGKYYTLLAGAAIVTGVTNVYQVGPGLPATANVSANALIPRTYRVNVVHNNANPITYSVGVLESV